MQNTNIDKCVTWTTEWISTYYALKIYRVCLNYQHLDFCITKIYLRNHTNDTNCVLGNVELVNWTPPPIYHLPPVLNRQDNIKRKKLHRINQGSNFLGGRFSNRDNVRAPIKFRGESQPQYLKRWFILKKDPSIFTSMGHSIQSVKY